MKRRKLEQMYKDATGLSAPRGSKRIDRLIEWIEQHDLKNFIIYNNPHKMRRDFRKGIRWYAGTQHGDTVLLGYTSRKGFFNTKNAVFAQSDEIEIEIE